MNSLSRAEFHQQHLLRAQEEAQRLFACKASMQGAWLAWVGAQIYSLRPAEFASMVRRELQRLQDLAEK
ncbi:hypothetical protein BK634_16220 [Pseudomonas chlororaphis]|nr:hypothetical protein BK634_16220 [Pseudomonas chlororaphis]